MYEKQPVVERERQFETDQLEESKEDISIEDYLKAIKHEQTLSQELIRKNFMLEELHKEMQRFIAPLYAKYLADSEVNQQI